MDQFSLVAYDETQVKLMQELCILVDEYDNVLGPVSKLEAHHGLGKLHRAFSLFLFDHVTNKLLLQRRSAAKITFPLLKTNSCCSHPLFTSAELMPEMGVKAAAHRRLAYELGINPNTFSIQDIRFFDKVKYTAASEDNLWSENESTLLLSLLLVDHILILTLMNPVLNINTNEVKEVEWVSFSELSTKIESDPSQFTPWLRLIHSQGLLQLLWPT